MRLIDADQIGFTDMEIIMCEGSSKKALELLIDKIANAPSIDAVPVKPAKLLDASPFGLCSECGFMIDYRDEFNYCPNCGSKMEKQL